LSASLHGTFNPVAAENVPMAQVLQDDVPSSSWYLPGMQSTHLATPFELEDVPLGQATQ